MPLFSATLTLKLVGDRALKCRGGLIDTSSLLEPVYAVGERKIVRDNYECEVKEVCGIKDSLIACIRYVLMCPGTVEPSHRF